MGEHYIEKCACGIIVSQCRCPEGFGETKSIRIVKCTHPNPPVTDAYTKEAVEWMNAPTGPMPNLTMTDARHAPNCVSLIDRECGVCTCGLPSQPREVLTQERVEYLCNEIDCNGNLPYIAELLLKHDAAQREHLRALADRLAEVARERDEAKNHSKKLDSIIARQRINLSRKYLGWAETKVGLQRTIEHLRAKAAGETPLFGHGAKDDLVANLRQQLTDAQATIARLQETPKDPLPEFMPCGDNSYWVSTFGNCIMCRARKAEQQVARLRECLVEYMTLADKICYAEPEYTQYHTMKTKASHALRETGA